MDCESSEPAICHEKKWNANAAIATAPAAAVTMTSNKTKTMISRVQNNQFSVPAHAKFKRIVRITHYGWRGKKTGQKATKQIFALAMIKMYCKCANWYAKLSISERGKNRWPASECQSNAELEIFVEIYQKSSFERRKFQPNQMPTKQILLM